jgi:hypothetical protein
MIFFMALPCLFECLQAGCIRQMKSAADIFYAHSAHAQTAFLGPAVMQIHRERMNRLPGRAGDNAFSHLLDAGRRLMLWVHATKRWPRGMTEAHPFVSPGHG